MMMALILFIAGLLTILLPCILPLIPIVLGVSISGRHPLRPLLTIAGMLISFVGFTFLLLVVLNQFVEVADYIRIATYDILLLFGVGFLTHRRSFQWVGAILGGLFFVDKGLLAVLLAAFFGGLAMEFGGRIAARIQQVGVDIQGKAREELGNESLLTAFIIGLTLGLVWVPCAGPALSFAFTLVREEPGLRAAFLLFMYGLGTAMPLLIVGYGGQWAVHAVQSLSRFSHYIKQVSGVLLIVTALGLQSRVFENVQVWLLTNTNFGNLGTRLEERLFRQDIPSPLGGGLGTSLRQGYGRQGGGQTDSQQVSPGEGKAILFPVLPKITRAPEFSGLGPWHNSEPLTLKELKGKVVLIDFWTYSCINCIRTLPYIQGYWEKFGDDVSLPLGGRVGPKGGPSGERGSKIPFVLIGIHTPEFVFEKSEKNVAEAIKRHGLTYPVAQDNDYGTWKAFANHYWPAKYLIDAQGFIRYTHFGEGAYEETERAIVSLLSEIGVIMDTEEADEGNQSEEKRYRPLSPETYLGTRSLKQLGNAPPRPTGKVVSYPAPESMELHKYYLVGDWQIAEGERQVLKSEEGEIRMKFLGGEINLVLGSAPSIRQTQDLRQASQNFSVVSVEVDGRPIKQFNVDFEDLYELWKGEYGEHEIILRIQGAGLSGYAFTFGS